jgi:hypothetical protein
MLAFAVGVGAGLAPLLGNAGAPGFSQLLALYPESVRGLAIPVAALAMGVVAAFVQYFAAAQPRIPKHWFVASGVLAILCLFALAYIYGATVTRVGYVGGRLQVAYITGFGPRPTSCANCPPGMSNEACIIGLPYPSLLASCFGDERLQLAGQALLYSHLASMLSFGALIGLLVLGRPEAGTARRMGQRDRDGAVERPGKQAARARQGEDGQDAPLPRQRSGRVAAGQQGGKAARRRSRRR